MAGDVYDLSAFAPDSWAALRAALRSGCARSDVAEIILPEGEFVISGTSDNTVTCSGSKVIRSRGRTTLRFSHNAPPLIFVGAVTDAASAAANRDSCTIQGLTYIRDWTTGDPVYELKSAQAGRFGGYVAFVDCHEYGANAFGITISNSAIAIFDRCSAQDHWGGVTGANGTDGLHAIGCGHTLHVDCYVDGVGDDAFSCGREVRSDTDATAPYPWVESASFIRCRTGTQAKGGVKMYCRVKKGLVEDCTIYGARLFGVNLDIGDPGIADSGVELGFGSIEIRRSRFYGCRGFATGAGYWYGAVGATNRGSLLAGRTINMGALLMEDCIVEGCTRAFVGWGFKSQRVSRNIVRNQSRRLDGVTDEEFSTFFFDLSNISGGDPVTVDFSENRVLDAPALRPLMQIYGGSDYGLAARVRSHGNLLENAQLGNTSVLVLTTPALLDITDTRLENVTAAAWADGNNISHHPRSTVELPEGSAGRPTRFNQAGSATPIYNQGPEFSVSAAPASGTHYEGASYPRSTGSVGQPVASEVASGYPGTFGALDAVSCTGSAGSRILKCNDVSAVHRGQIVTIAGAAGRNEVLRKERDGTLELKTPLTVDVTAAAVSYAAPLFVSRTAHP